MATVSEPLTFRQPSRIVSWLPLVLLPAIVFIAGSDWPAWIYMWTLSFAIYAGFKWLTFADSNEPLASNGRSLAYLFFWPGMDTNAFLDQSRISVKPRPNEWTLAIAKMMFGIGLIAMSKYVIDGDVLIVGWIGMTGVAFVLHFGLLHLLSVAWREAGVHAVPIMNAPALTSSLSDFWGRRWNLAFRDLAHTNVFRPSVRALGIGGATMTVFFLSGIIHDLVISTASGAGYGLPTLYFVIQGLGLLFERSKFGKQLGLEKAVAGRLYCAVVVLAPVGLLFHRPFIERVVVPMLRAL